MPLAKSDTSPVNGHRHMLVPVSVDPDDHLNCAMTLVGCDSCHLTSWTTAYRLGEWTQLRRGSWLGSYKVTAHRSRWLLMAILRMGRQIILRAYAPVTEWVRPDPGWPMKYHRSYRAFRGF